ncbi:DUF1564 family protein [Leptospira semungkisensis]|nr:DUF1564 family protein [Leptospira semungkisensis]
MKNKSSFYKSISRNISIRNRSSRLRPVSTLLIPPHLEKFVRCHGVTRLLREMLKVQRSILITAKRMNNYSANVRYQRVREQNIEGRYIKFNFRPAQNDWALLRNLAIGHGVSMCFLFVFLVEEYKQKQFSKDNKVIWKIKTKISLNVKAGILLRELWVLEYTEVNIDQIGALYLRGPTDPKLAS